MWLFCHCSSWSNWSPLCPLVTISKQFVLFWFLQSLLNDPLFNLCVFMCVTFTNLLGVYLPCYFSIKKMLLFHKQHQTKKKILLKWVRCGLCMLAIPELRRLRKENCQFDSSQDPVSKSKMMKMTQWWYLLASPHAFRLSLLWHPFQNGSVSSLWKLSRRAEGWELGRAYFGKIHTKTLVS